MTDRHLRLARDAKQDLREVDSWSVRQWGREQTDSYLADIRATFARLCRSPDLGRKRDDLGPGYRVCLCGKHVVIYRFDDRDLDILGVMHERMDISKRF